MDDDYLPLSAVFRHGHCPRQAYLFHREGAHAENRFTVEGNLLHARVTEGEDETRPGIRICRSIWLVSHRLRVRGISDVVEFHTNTEQRSSTRKRVLGISDVVEFHGDQPVPVEYKRGGTRNRSDEQAQLALQALCLEEMLGLPVPTGHIWHAKTRKRELVAIDTTLRQTTEAQVAAVHTTLAAERAPVAELGRWCASCSLNDHCLPSATGGRSAQDWITKALSD
jgi:CRISPR-associated exonuclease Cas4